MIVNAKDLLRLFALVPEKIKELLIDKPILNPEDHKYLFYIGLLGKKEEIKKRAEFFLEEIKEKLRDGKRLKTDKVIAAFLAVKISNKGKEILEQLNEFLKKRIELSYGPLRDMTNIFFLSFCFNLLSAILQTKIRNILNERFKIKSSPIFELILLGTSKFRIEEEKKETIAQQILQRLLTYSLEEISFKDAIYVEWFYQVFKENFMVDHKKRLENFTQEIRKYNISKIIRAIQGTTNTQDKENYLSLSNLEHVLLYEAVLHFEDILVLTIDEINERFKFAKKKLAMERGKWQSISLLFSCLFLALLSSIFILRVNIFTQYLLIVVCVFVVVSLIVSYAKYEKTKSVIEERATIFNGGLCSILYFSWLLLGLFLGLILTMFIPAVYFGMPEWIMATLSSIFSIPLSVIFTLKKSKEFFEISEEWKKLVEKNEWMDVGEM